MAKFGYDYQRDVENYHPNLWVCELCPSWDDINGCWAGYEDWRECPFDEDTYIDEEEDFDEGEMDGCLVCRRVTCLTDNGMCPMCYELNGGILP